MFEKELCIYSLLFEHELNFGYHVVSFRLLGILCYCASLLKC